MNKIFATSMSRYNGGVRVKRQWGSSTVTRFMVGIEGSPPSEWQEIDSYGATPGERKTYAINTFKKRNNIT